MLLEMRRGLGCCVRVRRSVASSTTSSSLLLCAPDSLDERSSYERTRKVSLTAHHTPSANSDQETMAQAQPTQEEIEDLVLCARYGGEEELGDMQAFVERYGEHWLAQATDDRGNSMSDLLALSFSGTAADCVLSWAQLACTVRRRAVCRPAREHRELTRGPRYDSGQRERACQCVSLRLSRCSCMAEQPDL